MSTYDGDIEELRQEAVQKNFARYNCCVDAAMSVIEGRWKGTILCMLFMNGPQRFSELEKRIGEVTSRILSKQLKELEADGMITRTVGSDRKLKVTYALTDKGTSILPVLKALGEWGAHHQMVQVIVPSAVSTHCDLDRNRAGAGSVELA
ncbi:MAG: helix-turn-helix domain-containing protein [Thermoplasmata archaeon]|nr:helix-turn-helix domain-containing protein [Thermoplasmata archaeon]